MKAAALAALSMRIQPDRARDATGKARRTEHSGQTPAHPAAGRVKHGEEGAP